MSGSLPISAGHALSQTPQGNKKTAGSQTSALDKSTPESKQTSTHPSDENGHKNAQHTVSNKDKDTSQTVKADKSDSKSHDKQDSGKAFPALFHSMMQDSKADPNVSLDKALADASVKNAKGDKDKKKTDADTAIGIPLFAAINGKDLPHLSWSGVVGVADNKGATAVAMQGNSQQGVTAQAVNAKDLSNAVLKAQEQLAKNQLQQGTAPGGSNNLFTAALDKTHPASLNLVHQFLADNASLPQAQTAAANGNAHNMLVQDLSNLASAASARSVANNAQQISVSVQQSQWGQQLGDRMQWLIGQNMHQAAIHLNPPELGSLDVHIQLHGDQANVNFSSPHAVVRHAVDAAIPRLRQMMQETGLMLGDVNVSGQAFAQQHQSRDSHADQSARGGRRVDAIAPVDEAQATSVGTKLHRLSANSMLDVYA